MKYTYIHAQTLRELEQRRDYFKKDCPVLVPRIEKAIEDKKKYIELLSLLKEAKKYYQSL